MILEHFVYIGQLPPLQTFSLNSPYKKNRFRIVRTVKIYCFTFPYILYMADTIHAVFLLKCLKQVIPIKLERFTFPDWTSLPFIFSSYLFHTVWHLVLIPATAGLNKIYHFHHNTTKNGKKKKNENVVQVNIIFVVWTHKVNEKRWFNITIRVLSDLNFSAFSESFSCCALIGFLSMLYKISNQVSSSAK